MNQILDFTKAIASRERLLIIGALTQKPAARSELAMQLNLPLQEVSAHLDHLQQAGVILASGEQFMLNEEKLATLGRDAFHQPRESYIPAPELDEKSKRVLKAFLNADGSIKQIPPMPKLPVILNYLAQAFEPGVDYTEKEVNIIIRRFHDDTAGLRRDLIEANLLARESDGSRYWRTK